MKVINTRFSVRFFTAVLILTGMLLVMLVNYDYKAEEAIKNLKDRYNQIDHFRNDIIHYNEVLTMSARMAAATGDIKWEKRYHTYEPKLTAAISQGIRVSPEIYRQETDRSNIHKFKLLEMEHEAFILIRQGQGKAAMDILFGRQYEIQENNYIKAIERLNMLLKQQMQAALGVEHSKEYLARVSFITVLCLLLLSWLIVLRIARQTQEELIETNLRLSESTHKLDELNHTLEEKVQERTKSLTRALDHVEKVYQDLKDAQAQLMQSEKFFAIGQLAAGIANEINNPVGFINSNLQTLQKYIEHYTQLVGIVYKLEKALKDKDQQRASQMLASCDKIRRETNFAFIEQDIGNLLKESREGIEKISKIVTDLRIFASSDAGMMDSVNIEALMDSVLNIVHNEIKYRAQLRKDYHNVPLVVCNPQNIGQVFVNLLINASQAIEGKGTITVKTYTKDAYVCVDITDTGRGIAPDDIAKIFDPFFTTKSPGTGTGLGLSVSHDIVSKHGGAITVSSKLGHGTTFTVILPQAASSGLESLK